MVKKTNQLEYGESADRKSDQDKPLHEKTTDDFAKYVKHTCHPPNIRNARKRFREDIKVHYDFDIPEDMQNIGKGKKYLIQTYGCLMNEHDTEVMAGILTNMGYEGTTDTEEADIILLNTCAIRERSEEHTSELQSRFDLVCRLLLEKKNQHDT